MKKQFQPKQAAWLREIRDALGMLVDPEYREGIGRIVPTTNNILGVRVPAIRGLVKEFAARHDDLDLGAACEFMDAAAAERGREEMLFATFLLARFRRWFVKAEELEEMWRHIDAWVEAVDNWETCDQLATNVASPVVAAQIDRVRDLVEWAGSGNAWRRRFAVVTTAGLNQKGRRFPAETLRVCEALMNDPDAMVQKAVGWALREATEADEGLAAAFLLRWKGKGAPRIMREGSEKLSRENRELLR
ncbi:MAG TPA: DNA alkylation repair protein [Candidatus Kapabacteria bacterium]|nr:DNA alkylation repair protein [Candidatus Kapabacteria bacterium]